MLKKSVLKLISLSVNFVFIYHTANKMKSNTILRLTFSRCVEMRGNLACRHIATNILLIRKHLEYSVYYV